MVLGFVIGALVPLCALCWFFYALGDEVGYHDGYRAALQAELNRVHQQQRAYAKGLRLVKPEGIKQ